MSLSWMLVSRKGHTLLNCNTTSKIIIIINKQDTENVWQYLS